ncbi:MAG TPA: hypothetical protein VK307_13310 [Thermoleophilaceae bacterium]|nr:hypothetical protein [Thermoleophilaceae bacterium]
MYALELGEFRVRSDHLRLRPLQAGRARLVRALRDRYPGFRSAHLSELSAGRWLDVSLWRSRHEAEAARAEVERMDEMVRWRAQVEEFSGD